MKKSIIYYVITFLFCQMANAQIKNAKQSHPPEENALLTVHFDYWGGSDTITVKVHSEFNYSHIAPTVNTLKQITKNGHAFFTIPDLTQPIRISLYHSAKKLRRSGVLEEQPIFEKYLIAPGDSIVLHSNFNVNAFTGKGVERMRSWHKLIQNNWQERLETNRPFARDSTTAIRHFLNEEVFLQSGLQQLHAMRPQLSQQDYKILKAEWIGRFKTSLYQNMVWFDFNVRSPKYGNAILDYYGKYFLNEKPQLDPDSVWLESPSYCSYLTYKTIADEKYKLLALEKIDVAKMPSTSDLLKKVVNTRFDGIVKDKILMQWALHAGVSNEYAFLRKHINDEHYLQYLENDMDRHYKKGIQLIDFAFEDKQGNTVTLSDYKGKVVFIDMWFTGCGGCIQVAEAMPKIEEKFSDNKDVVFLSISVDKDKDKWLHSIDNNAKPDKKYPLAGKHYSGKHTQYFYTAGRERDDEFIKRYNPMDSYPQLLLVDRQGRMYSSSPPRPDGKDGGEKLIALINEALKNK